MTTIGLIAAMQSEAAALLKRVSAPQQLDKDTWHFQVGGNDCWLIQSGMGAVNAASAASRLLEGHEAQVLVNFGIAGAVLAGLDIGDVILARRACLLQAGRVGQFIDLALLPQDAVAAVEIVLPGRSARFLFGTAVTTDGSQFVDMQDQPLEHPVLEMETHAAALVAREKGIPLFALRSISDNPAAPIPFDLTRIIDENSHFRWERILADMFRHPSKIKKGMTMLRNSTTACDNVALALLAVLEGSSQLKVN